MARSVRKPGARGAEGSGVTGLDLNLLRVFDVVMIERHVTRAAQRLAMTQSAVSNALGRLRRELDDPLFQKSASGVEPTPKALEMWPRVHQALEDLDLSVNPRAFRAAESHRTFGLTVVDLVASLLLPELQQRLRTRAPYIRLKLLPLDESAPSTRLTRGSADFSVVLDIPRLAALQSTPLWVEPFVLVARKGHPLLGPGLTLAALCEARHVLVNMTGAENFQTAVDLTLAAHGLARQITLTVNYFMVTASVLLRSDLVAVMPESFVRMPGCASGLASCPLPPPLTNLNATMYLMWHRRNTTSAAHEWFKSLLFESLSALQKPGAPLAGADSSLQEGGSLRILSQLSSPLRQ